MLPQGSLGFLIRTSYDWSRGFSSCYHSKMGKHIAKSSSLTCLPLSVRLTHLQATVRSVPELRIMETTKEYMSLTHLSTSQYTLTYDSSTMLQNAYYRYDNTLEQTTSRMMKKMSILMTTLHQKA